LSIEYLDRSGFDLNIKPKTLNLELGTLNLEPQSWETSKSLCSNTVRCILTRRYEIPQPRVTRGYRNDTSLEARTKDKGEKDKR